MLGRFSEECPGVSALVTHFVLFIRADRLNGCSLRRVTSKKPARAAMSPMKSRCRDERADGELLNLGAIEVIAWALGDRER